MTRKQNYIRFRKAIQQLVEVYDYEVYARYTGSGLSDVNIEILDGLIGELEKLLNKYKG